MEKVKAPGLKWRKLAAGFSPVWVADEKDVAGGYRPKTLSLKHLADQPALLVAQCNALQADMMLWRVGHRHDPLHFDGTVRSLLEIYERHPDSPFQALKPATLKPYVHYLGKLRGHIGSVRLDDISGVDIKRWHRIWSNDGMHLAAAAMARAVLNAAISFGIMLRLAGCADLAVICRETQRKLPQPRPRTIAATADQVIAARQAAHAAGRPSSALAYALVFETTMRLWDVIGQWWPLDQGGISAVIDGNRGEKWMGLTWENIGQDLVLNYTPSKTSETSGRAVAFSLQKAPMVMEELSQWTGARAGPIIVSETTGLPYRPQEFSDRWALDRKVAGLPTKMWARDLRASGITEGRAMAVATDDIAKVAGHSSKRTTATVYDRAVLEAADRFADARMAGRERTGNDRGNGR